MSNYYFAILEELESEQNCKIQVYFPELDSAKNFATSFEEAMDLAAPLLVKTVQNLIFLNKKLPDPLSFSAFKKKYSKVEDSPFWIQAFKCPEMDKMPVKTTFTISQINLHFLERERLSLGVTKSELVNSFIERERERKSGR